MQLLIQITKIRGVNMTRQEKIEFCKKARKETNSNPAIRFEDFDDHQLNNWVKWFKSLLDEKKLLKEGEVNGSSNHSTV